MHSYYGVGRTERKFMGNTHIKELARPNYSNPRMHMQPPGSAKIWNYRSSRNNDAESANNKMGHA